MKYFVLKYKKDKELKHFDMWNVFLHHYVEELPDVKNRPFLAHFHVYVLFYRYLLIYRTI